MTKDQFMDSIVFGWMKKDLESISRIRVMAPQSGNANFPLALIIIIYMGQLGSYMRGSDGSLEENIREYLTCFSDSSQYHPELLNDLFRNGLAHDYFSRGGISRSGMRPSMTYSSGIGVILDADSLLEDFLASLVTFRHTLTEENYQSRFEEAGRMMEARYVTHEAIIDRLPPPPNPVVMYPHTPSSTASGGTAIYSDEVSNEDDV